MEFIFKFYSNQDAISDVINKDYLYRLYRCNGVDTEILRMLQKLCGYHQIFQACIIDKIKCKRCMTSVMRDVLYYNCNC